MGNYNTPDGGSKQRHAISICQSISKSRVLDRRSPSKLRRHSVAANSCLLSKCEDLRTCGNISHNRKQIKTKFELEISC